MNEYIDLTEKEISALNGLRRRGSDQAVLHLWMLNGEFDE